MSDEERATLGFISGAISAGMTNTTEPSADDAARLRDLLASLADESNVDYEEQHEIAQIVEANIDVICAALSASPAPSQSELVEAREVAASVTDYTGYLRGGFDETPFMRSILAALKRGIEIGQGK
jgi:hypothetical protein